MSEAKHTPAPWHWDGETGDVLDTVGRRVHESYDEDGLTLGALERLEADANARLIAAAPALLEAAEQAERAMTAWAPSGTNLAGCECSNAVRALRAAIAEARGEA